MPPGAIDPGRPRRTATCRPDTSLRRRGSRLWSTRRTAATARTPRDRSAAASSTNHRNRSIARLLRDYGRVSGDPDAVVDLYTRQSCRTVSARDLAVMGATLADGGVNPLTGDRVVDAETCRYTLAVMATAGH